MDPAYYVLAFLAGFVLLSPTALEYLAEGLGWAWDLACRMVGR